MELLEGIYSRRSVREFTDEPVTDEQVREIIKAGSWAPSGLNNQPWRFVIIRSPEGRSGLAECTKYRSIVLAAPASVAVFCDREAMYNDLKDHQGIGACLQNMLLAAHALGLGAVWLGEILNRSAEVCRILATPPSLELMAVIAIGHPVSRTRSSRRRKLPELIVAER